MQLVILPATIDDVDRLREILIPAKRHWARPRAQCHRFLRADGRARDLREAIGDRGLPMPVMGLDLK
jgi:hypothetical protein